MGKLVELGPSVLIYTMSFMTLGIFWVGQSTLLGQLARLGAFEYGLRAGLFRESSPSTVARLVRGRVLIAQSLYAFATALSIVFPTWVSIALIVLVQLNYVIAPRIPVLHRF